jgi:superfamily II DNA/RNA helicase
MFSATLDRAVDGLVARHLHNPAVHSVDPIEGSSELVEHHVFSVQLGHKAAVVADLASGRGRTLLFTRTKYGAKKLARQLSISGIPAVELHSNLSQSVRQRNLAQFTDGSVRVLVATDIAARGIHVDDVALVVHVDPPAEHKTFLHRSGRTARAGAAGAVVTIVTPDQAKEVRSLVRQAGIQPSSHTVVPGDPQTGALTGPPAARRAVKAPANEAASQHRNTPPSRRPNRSASRRQSSWAPKTRHPRPTPTASNRGTPTRDSGQRDSGGARSGRRQPR